MTSQQPNAPRRMSDCELHFLSGTIPDVALKQAMKEPPSLMLCLNESLGFKMEIF